jgi:hypothetical protein
MFGGYASMSILDAIKDARWMYGMLNFDPRRRKFET